MVASTVGHGTICASECVCVCVCVCRHEATEMLRRGICLVWSIDASDCVSVCVCVRETAYSIAVGVGTVWLMGLQPMFSSVCEKNCV